MPRLEYPSDADYFAHIQAEHNKVRLLQQTVTPELRAAMIEQVINPELQDGVYVEVGFGADPYMVKTPRVFTETSCYIGMDGGASDYYSSEHFGWGEANRPYTESVWSRATQSSTKSDNAPHSLLIRADAQRMPLPEAADAGRPVREIYLGDVLITPGVHHQSQLRIFQECARVID